MTGRAGWSLTGEGGGSGGEVLGHARAVEGLPVTELGRARIAVSGVARATVIDVLEVDCVTCSTP